MKDGAEAAHAARLRLERLAERLKQRAVHRVALRVVLGVPLNAERKARRVGDADRLDRAVFRHALDDDALAGLENALAMQRVHADGLPAEELREGAARNESDVMAVGEDDGRIGMDLAVSNRGIRWFMRPGNSRISGCSEPPKATFIS